MGVASGIRFPVRSIKPELQTVTSSQTSLPVPVITSEKPGLRNLAISVGKSWTPQYLAPIQPESSVGVLEWRP